MAVGLTSTGFEAKSLTAIQDEVNAAFRANISSTLNLSETSILGQYIGTGSSQMRQLWEAQQDLYAATDFDQATEDALGNLTKLTGTRRNAATPSTVLMTVTLAAGTYAANSLVVHVVGDPTSRFSNDAEITTAGATIVGVPFTAEEDGPTRANANTLTVIANPVVGFSAPTNPAEAVLGLEIETDAELRIRHQLELARTGSSTVDAIRIDIQDYSDAISFVATFENDTDVTDGDGRPPHSVESIVLGGTDAEVAAAVFASKPAGIRAYGTTTSSVTDSQGNIHSVSYTRPTVVTIYIDLALTVISGEYAGDSVVKTAITDWCDANLGVGKDVIQTRIEALALSVAGVVDATAEIGLSAGAGTADANYVIGPREIASVDSDLTNTASDHIVITQTIVTTAP